MPKSGSRKGQAQDVGPSLDCTFSATELRSDEADRLSGDNSPAESRVLFFSPVAPKGLAHRQRFKEEARSILVFKLGQS
jgi:hypothetical protein